MPGATIEEDPFVDALVQTSFAVMTVLTKAAAENDLSLTQLRLLGTLRNREPRMSELAAFLGLDRSTVSGLVDRAASRGLVARADDPDDRRSSRVGLTAAGRRAARRVTGEVAEEVRRLTAHLTAAERRTVQAALERVLAG